MKSYPCVGGPLDGQKVTRQDLYEPQIASRSFGTWKVGDVMREGGIHGAVGKQYHEFNRANRWSKVPSMVWLHESLIPTTKGKA